MRLRFLFPMKNHGTFFIFVCSPILIKCFVVPTSLLMSVSPPCPIYHSQSCICSYFHLHCPRICLLYCNSLLIGLPKTRLSPLQTVLNAAARLIARLPRYSHISYYIKEHLHWLPISTRIEYKVLLIVLKAQMGVAPKYLRDTI